MDLQIVPFHWMIKVNVRILTGKKASGIAGSGVLGIKTWGQQQLHNARSNIQYCVGGTENEGQALNVLAYGDVVEQAIGGTRYIQAIQRLKSLLQKNLY